MRGEDDEDNHDNDNVNVIDHSNTKRSRALVFSQIPPPFVLRTLYINNLHSSTDDWHCVRMANWFGTFESRHIRTVTPRTSIKREAGPHSTLATGRLKRPLPVTKDSQQPTREADARFFILQSICAIPHAPLGSNCDRPVGDTGVNCEFTTGSTRCRPAPDGHHGSSAADSMEQAGEQERDCERNV
uniref:Uncharacterized protein n=1 Tax=Anopheles atroparvus TaxID=41427 RepID=A0A182JJR5_ANOAO